ncbi:MAG: hypothetical protein KBT47_08210 [Armatimonadetes bacterium]|nr:hypothetical protein [Candidatus Hippobium faecium]
MTSEIITLEGWGKCLKLSNGKIETVTTVDLGPRIIGFNFVGGKNMLNPIGKKDPNKTAYGEFYTYGGHRLWHAPEGIPRSYVPDNDPIKYEITDNGAVFYYNFEKETGIDKKFEIIMGEDCSIEVKHTLTNRNVWAIKCAPWALTIVAPGGRLLIPNEPFIPHTDKLLPARPLVLWNYTNMADKRWTWGEKFTQLVNIEEMDWPQKAGFLVKKGWAAYELDGTVFMKKFGFIEGKEYPDYNVNLETFTKGTFHEFETVAPLSELAPDGGKAEYTEKWALLDAELGDCEKCIEEKLEAFAESI